MQCELHKNKQINLQMLKEMIFQKAKTEVRGYLPGLRCVAHVIK